MGAAGRKSTFRAYDSYAFLHPLELLLNGRKPFFWAVLSLNDRTNTPFPLLYCFKFPIHFLFTAGKFLYKSTTYVVSGSKTAYSECAHDPKGGKDAYGEG